MDHTAIDRGTCCHHLMSVLYFLLVVDAFLLLTLLGSGKVTLLHVDMGIWKIVVALPERKCA